MTAVIGRCHGVISSGVSPGASARRSAISSSAISRSSGIGSSTAMSNFPLIRHFDGFFFEKAVYSLAFSKKKRGAYFDPAQ
jgi:hypothetical protein